jgi:TolA-binding protein
MNGEGAKRPMTIRSSRALAGALAILATGLTAVPAAAQDNAAEARIRKIEAEVRALQRQVFPGGGGRFFEPEIASGAQGAASPSTPSSTAVTDILARLDALEAQMQALTAQTEQNTNAVAQLQGRIAALEGGVAPAATVPASTAATTPAATTPATTTTTTPARPATTPAATGPSAQRLAAVQAIAKPQTEDPGDDEYSYGFRLWEAKFFPEAQQQLALFVEKHPRHTRVSFGRNLLGRAFLDDGKPRDAATWFLRNYQADKNGARAGDSLLYLAESMIALKDTSRACIALSEFAETYPALATGRLSGQYEANRQKVTCN